MNLIFDFDGTITVRDTIGELAQAGIVFQQDRYGKHLQPAWDNAVQAYLEDYKSYNNSYQPRESKRRTVSEELEFLSGLKDVENTSLDRVERSGVFSGLKRADLFQMGIDKVKRGSIIIRDGFEEMIELAEQRGYRIGVISVNWSRAFIEGVLHPHNIQVIANEISEDGKIQGPEFLGSRMTNSSDKAKCLSREVAERPGPALYFGDSTTDMECLLHQKGIVISTDDTSSLLQTLSRVGIRVPHVSGNLHDEANIFWARDFGEVLRSKILEHIF